MTYKHIWIIETKLKTGRAWHLTAGRFFFTRKSAGKFIKEVGWGGRGSCEYRVSKYMGPIKSGCIKEI